MMVGLGGVEEVLCLERKRDNGMRIGVGTEMDGKVVGELIGGVRRTDEDGVWRE